MKRCPICGCVFSLEATFCAEDGASLVEAKPPFIEKGLRFGDYTAEYQLGRGAMGVVWRCMDAKRGYPVAVKFMSDEMFLRLGIKPGGSKSSTIERFLREARAAQKIKHNHVIKIFDAGELPNGLPYYVMETLQGTPLDEYIREKGPLPLAEIETILEPICQALFLGHSLKIVHRDLKPANLFLVHQEGKMIPKVLDFGVAKLGGEGAGLTASGASMGSPYYMSPEQWGSAKYVDARSDVYALGIILFELLTGTTPFRAEDPEDNNIQRLMNRHLNETPPPPSTRREGISKALDAVVLQTLQKDPKDRYQTALEFFDAFSSAVSNPLLIEESKPAPKLAPSIHALAQTAPLALPSSASASHSGDYAGESQESPPPKRSILGVIISAGVALTLGVGAYAISALTADPTPKTENIAYTATTPKEAPKVEKQPVPASVGVPSSSSQPASAKTPTASNPLISAPATIESNPKLKKTNTPTTPKGPNTATPTNPVISNSPATSPPNGAAITGDPPKPPKMKTIRGPNGEWIQVPVE